MWKIVPVFLAAAGLASPASAQTPPALPSTGDSSTALLVVTAAAAPADSRIADLCTPACDCRFRNRFFADAEFLYWTTQGVSVAPVVTAGVPTTPLGGMGMLNSPNTISLFGGNNQLLNNFRPGLREEAGVWLDDDQTIGLSERFFFLGVLGNGAAGVSNGAAPLAFPSISQPALTIAYPGVARGSFDVNTGTNFLGGDVDLRSVVARGPNARFDLFGGYRTLHLGDTLADSFDTAAIVPAGSLPGPRMMGEDSIRTRNDFHGGLLGLLYTRGYGPLTLSFESSIALGATVSYLDSSSTRSLGMGGGPVVPVTQLSHSNTSTYFGAVPEAGVKLGWNPSNSLRLTAGYNFIYWSTVRRAQQEFNETPVVQNQTTGFWAQGWNLGLELRY